MMMRSASGSRPRTVAESWLYALTHPNETAQRFAALQGFENNTKFDKLGILNQVGLASVVSTLFAKPGRSDCVFVASFDLENFKLTNEILGHNGADEVLRAIGKTDLGRDAVVARLGGDEFAVALLASDKEAAETAMFHGRRKMWKSVEALVIDRINEGLQGNENPFFSYALEKASSGEPSSSEKRTHLEANFKAIAKEVTRDLFGMSFAVVEMQQPSQLNSTIKQGDIEMMAMKRVDGLVFGGTQQGIIEEQLITIDKTKQPRRHKLLKHRLDEVSAYTDILHWGVAISMARTPPAWLLPYVPVSVLQRVLMSPALAYDISLLAGIRLTTKAIGSQELLSTRSIAEIKKREGGGTEIEVIKELAANIHSRVDADFYTETERRGIYRAAPVPTVLKIWTN